jgi:hypothetical protein
VVDSEPKARASGDKGKDKVNMRESVRKREGKGKNEREGKSEHEGEGILLLTFPRIKVQVIGNMSIFAV